MCDWNLELNDLVHDLKIVYECEHVDKSVILQHLAQERMKITNADYSVFGEDERVVDLGWIAGVEKYVLTL